MTAPLLELDKLEVTFGAVRACDGIDLAIHVDSTVGIVGPNGSGKTTLFRAICGDVRPTGGRVLWRGHDVTRWPTDRVARSGLVRTHQQSMVFPSMTVLENLRFAEACAASGGRGGVRRPEETRIPSDAESVLRLTQLEEARDVRAAGLPTGILRRVGIALALVARPALLLLDEPAAGLNVPESQTLSELLRHLRSLGMAIIVVDHDMSFILPLCDRLVVLDAGRKLVEGIPDEVRQNPEVIRIYLGEAFSSGKASL